jgi:hypothetical protein
LVFGFMPPGSGVTPEIGYYVVVLAAEQKSEGFNAVVVLREMRISQKSPATEWFISKIAPTAHCVHVQHFRAAMVEL